MIWLNEYCGARGDVHELAIQRKYFVHNVLFTTTSVAFLFLAHSLTFLALEGLCHGVEEQVHDVGEPFTNKR